MKIFYIDLFSGAGGTTTGVHLVGHKDIDVVACVNHDVNAIKSHKENWPRCLHLTEDVTDMEVVKILARLVKRLRAKHQDCKIVIWASLECTNFSNAKGGLPRDADSRTLAYAMYEYLEHLKPDYLMIENVREFMAWGPLDENGKPVSRLKGRDFMDWVEHIKGMGYDYNHQLLNSADFGAHTSRTRYFAQFAKDNLPIAWPTPTHSKNPEQSTIFNGKLKKWKAVKEVLDLEDEGESIFRRKKPYVDATLRRIYAGLVKFVAGGEKAFIQKNFSGKPMGKVNSLNVPAGAITTVDNKSLVHTEFLTAYYSGGGQLASTKGPCPTIPTKDTFAKIKPDFLVDYQYKSGAHDIDNPSPTLLTKDKFAKARVQFIDQQFGNSKPSSSDKPMGVLTKNPKYNLVSTKPWLLNTNFANKGNSVNDPAPVITANRKWHYLMNPQFNSAGASIDNPCFTLIARMDKKPPYILQAQSGAYGIKVDKNDSEAMIKIKEFMVLYGIVDIKMRMLKVGELLRIQGFPEDYKLIGTQTDKKKYIGNAVVPIVASKIAEANMNALRNQRAKAA